MTVCSASLSAEITGAALTKFGRAPRTCTMGWSINFPSVHRNRLRSPAVFETTRHRAKVIVYPAGLAWRQLRDDPRRAGRLAVRLALRNAPGRLRRRLGRTRLGALAKPRPRDPRREAADLRVMLAQPVPARLDQADPGQATSGPPRVLHLVTNALPRTNAGYTVRTHQIALAQRAAGLEPHVVTRLGYPLAQGVADTRPTVNID